MRWMYGIIGSLALFVAGQCVLIWIAVTHKDEIVTSYTTEKR